MGFLVDKTTWEMLNATADDCENLEQIYRQVCYSLLPDNSEDHNATFLYKPAKDAPFLSEIADRIRLLVEQGFLTIVMDEEGHRWRGRDDLSYVWRCWFSMTPQGNTLWESSKELLEQD